MIRWVVLPLDMGRSENMKELTCYALTLPAEISLCCMAR